VSARGGSRYNKNVVRTDPKGLDPTSAEYWEAVLKREGLGMQRGKSAKLVYGWEYRDTDESDDSERDDGA
jgi:hypothetical protein